MLAYEKIAFDDFLEKFYSEEISILLKSNKSLIKNYSKKLKAENKIVLRQIRLHVPQFTKADYNKHNFLNKNIFPIIEPILKNYCKCFEYYRNRYGGDILNGKAKIKRNRANKSVFVEYDDKKTFTKIRVDTVSKEDGDFIESNLHYLHARREDSILRLGVYVENCSMPFCYMNFALVDRPEKMEALRCSLNTEIETKDVVELTRVYGFGSLPTNTISFLIANAVDYLIKTNFKCRYMITAVNTYLGFNGTSILASGFVPYAFRPVKYMYDNVGCYTTTRKGGGFNAKSETPPNILFVKEFNPAEDSNIRFSRLITIKNGKYELATTEIEHQIYEIRRDLESVWSEETRYHGTKRNEVRFISKGQCGVSSLLLALKLQEQRYSVLFCEGDAYFEKKIDNQDTSIENHCWIKLLNYNGRNINVIIDITADQNGYSQKIIFKTEKELSHSKVTYISKSEKKPNDVDVEHLKRRLSLLQEKLLKIESEDDELAEQ